MGKGKNSDEKKPAPVSLVELFDDGNYDYQYVGAKLSLSVINVLPQPRKTFTNIDILGEDIARCKLLHPMIVAEFDADYCERYLDAIGRIWGLAPSLAELVPTTTRDGPRYYVLLAGERRYRAFSYLWSTGCERCRSRGTKLRAGSCFRRHFRSGAEVRLCRNIPPLQAIYRQLAENTHERVPPHEEAIAIGETYRLAQQVKPDMTAAALARQISMGEHKVRSAVAFFGLPDSIKTATAEKTGKRPTGEQTISYGIALQLARLYEDGESEDELHRWATRALVNGMIRQVEEFKELVDRYLVNKHSGQIGLFGDAQEAQLVRRNYREVVARNYILSYHVVMRYLAVVEDHFERGTLGESDSPFSVRSPLRALRKLLAYQEKVLAHMLRYLPRTECQRAIELVSELKSLTSAREEALEEAGVD